jgi:hypothetical protein
VLWSDWVGNLNLAVKPRGRIPVNSSFSKKSDTHISPMRRSLTVNNFDMTGVKSEVNVCILAKSPELLLNVYTY